MANENRPSWLLGENLSDSEVTPEQVYHSRRDFIKNGAYAFAAAAGSSLLFPNQAQAAADLKPTKEDLEEKRS